MKRLKLYFILLLVVLCNIKPIYCQQNKIDSLLNLIKTDKEDTFKVKHYTRIYLQYLSRDEYDSALIYINKALVLAKKAVVGKEIGWRKGVGNCYLNIGVLHVNKGNYQDALRNYLVAKKEYTFVQHKQGLALVNNNIGLVYEEQGKYADALNYYFASLKVSEQMNDKSSMVLSYNNLGNSNHWLGNDSAALRYYDMALKLATELDLKENISLAYNNIGVVYDGQGNYPEALKNYSAALKIAKEINDKDNEGRALSNIGLVYSRQHLYPQALQMYQASLKLNEEIGDKKGIFNSYLNLGDVYTETHKIKEAEFHLNKSLKLSLEMDRKGDVMKVYQSLVILDSIKGNYKDAYKHHVLLHVYKDSIYNEENRQKSMQASMQYEFDKKEAAIKFENDKRVLDLENRNKLSKQKQVFLIIGIVIFVLLTLVVLFFAKRAYDNKKKYSEVLSKENEQKETLLQEVHHRVNNSLQMISSLLSIQAETALNEDVQEYLLKTENRIHAMSEMHQLLHETNTQLEVDIEIYLLRVLDFYKQILEANTQIKLYAEIPSVKFHSKTAMPLALIVNELLTNAIKYAFPGKAGVIKITLTKSETDIDKWTLIISDNGVGMQAKKEPTNGSGLGLEIVRIMVRQIGAEMQVKVDNGTAFHLMFNSFTPGG